MCGPAAAVSAATDRQRNGLWMQSSEKQLTERIRQIRRRHFGPRGKKTFAERLGIPLAEYESIEKGTLPTGELMVRMCETTAEDLQWLLTGVASRGTMVISGTRGRHQQLLAGIAALLNSDPAKAGPLEAFVELLNSDVQSRPAAVERLPEPRQLLPIFDVDELPDDLSDDGGDPAGSKWLALVRTDGRPARRAVGLLGEPQDAPAADAHRKINLVNLEFPDGAQREFVQSAVLAECFPGMFGVRIRNEDLEPILSRNDIALVVQGVPAKPGRPALCRLAGSREPTFRVWLGRRAGRLHLGRLSNGSEQRVEEREVLWSLEILYCVRRAA